MDLQVEELTANITNYQSEVSAFEKKDWKLNVIFHQVG
jgi:hypothetical protein